MILIAALLGGALIGYRVGSDRRGSRMFVVMYSVVFVVQTVFLLATADNPRNRQSGEWDLGYFPFALVILLLGHGVLHGAGALRRRRARNGVDLAR